MTGRPNATDAVYTEADMAIAKETVRQEFQNLAFTQQLAQLAGRLDSLPGQIRAVAREVALEVLRETQQERERETTQNLNKFNTLSQVIQAGTAVMMVIVTLLVTAQAFHWIP